MNRGRCLFGNFYGIGWIAVAALVIAFAIAQETADLLKRLIEWIYWIYGY